jgi:ATP-dependent helicase/nuclease subunit A
MNLRIISAGAGSGKTYRLTSELVQLLSQGVRPSGIIATTFTKKAAAELQERVRVRLLEEGLREQADQLSNALIGTVHGLGVKLLQRFAFEAGVAPDVSIIADEDQQILFNLSLATVLTHDRVATIEQLSDRLGLNKREHYDWRREIRTLTEIARANDFSIDQLEESKQQSFTAFQQLLGSEPVSKNWEDELNSLLRNTIARLDNNEDSTKKTQSAINTLKSLQRRLQLQGNLYWHEWAKLSKMDVGAKSREDVEALKTFTTGHHAHPQFQQDVKAFIDEVFDVAMSAIDEFDQYKKRRGLIDYTDMEVLVNQLLNNPQVQNILSEEIDLLMVDEFQDTSPIQLEIFLKISRLAKHSIWVGDPKQSIYGFRGAAPELMQAVIEKVGGIRPADIQTHSWRSREDIVNLTNAIFCKSFHLLPKEQVALQAKRKKKGGEDSITGEAEPITLGPALRHWHFQHEGNSKRPPGKPWMENCIAFTLKEMLDSGLAILPKGKKETRIARPGDVAILCRSNAACQAVAEALHRAGLKAAISRAGLLHTAEAKLILACLKYLLHQYDSLSIAEILLLASGQTIEGIIENRLDYLHQQKEGENNKKQWGGEDTFIKKLNKLRDRAIELSSAETLDLMLEELDIRRIIAAWGNTAHRLDNVEVLRKMALQYEEACNRLHTAASTGGFLLWLADQENNANDMQASGESESAINVMTYHRSKGLEWPIVVCHNLEGRLRADVWGVDIIAQSSEVDLQNVLANRWLRYWVNPYADQGRRTYLEEQLENSEAQKRVRQKALQEEARLLYVGITRARDYLVFPSRKTPTRWLNRVWHNGEEDFPTLDPESNESPWEWEGHYLDIQTGVFTYDTQFDLVAEQEEEILYFEERIGAHRYPTHEIDTSAESFSDEIQIHIGDQLSYVMPLSVIPEGVDQYELAKALKAFHTAYYSDYTTADKLDMAKGFIERYELSDLAPEQLTNIGDQWQSFLERQFSGTSILRKYPIQYYHHNRLFSTMIDLVIDTPNGLVLIQNSGFAGTETQKQKNRALKNLGPWAYLSSLAVQSVMGAKPPRIFVHFVMSGQLTELVVIPSS